jgi:Tetratricopeptide repeat/Cytochrome c554 and c-prime
MTDASQSDPARGVTVRRRHGLIVLVMLSTFGLIAACLVWRESWLSSLIRGSSTSVQQPLELNSPYRNTRADVHYVGDAACARCHADLAQAYRDHPMGRSLKPIDLENIPGTGAIAFQAQGLEYSVERRGDRVFHKEIKRGHDGKVISQNEAEARYVIGSGEQAQAFLLERGDGHLFESPITWYSRKQKWDLSPGYEKDNLHFERFVKPACLFCHSNRFDHVEGTENRYRQPIFLGHAIGCERCHGPGELHVKKPEQMDNDLPNIVNPAKLQPALRESVCQQCHLHGDIRIVRADRSLTDYRPGLPLSSIESVFVKAENVGMSRFFGQVEQMYESRCFRESAGKMGCISCHDPHELPRPHEKAPYYRDRCLNCHAEKGCSLPKPERLSQSRDDSCIDCHMPRSPNEQVPHTATTVHLILRSPGRIEPVTDLHRQSKLQDVPLIHFHRDQLDPDEQSLVTRDRGIALARSSRTIPGWSAGKVSRMALPLLETSLKSHPLDGSALEAKGTVLWLLGRREESLSAFRAALTTSPNREETLVAAGTRAAQVGKRDEALSDFGQAIAINPFRADYHQVVALLQSQRQEWNAAIEAARDSLRLNPSNYEARMLLIQCLLKIHRLEEARHEFQVLLDHDPPGRDAIKAWFEKSQHP